MLRKEENWEEPSPKSNSPRQACSSRNQICYSATIVQGKSPLQSQTHPFVVRAGSKAHTRPQRSGQQPVSEAGHFGSEIGNKWNLVLSEPSLPIVWVHPVKGVQDMEI